MKPEDHVQTEPDSDADQRDPARRRLQAMLDDQKGQEERNQLGQFATPDTLANEIVQVAKSFLNGRTPVDFLEPAIGMGAFFAAVLHNFRESELGRCSGYEVDPHYGVPARELWDGTRIRIHIGDFTATPAPYAASSKFDLVATNPPYVRHHHIPRNMKRRLRRHAARVIGTEPSGLSGLYPYFVYLAHEWMRPGAIGAWLLPSEFMYADYGTELRSYLLEHVSLLRVHRFDPGDLQFDDALVSSAVVFVRYATPDKDHGVLFTYGRSISEPESSSWIPIRDLDGRSKWRDLHARGPRSETKGVRLGGVFIVRRGLATGADRFFILSQAEVEEYKLPKEWLRPILPSPRYLETNVIESSDGENPDIPERRYLLSCDLPEKEIREKHPHLWEYLVKGVAKGYHERYLCSHRSPWYKQENAEPAPILCSYMGHSRNGNRPFRFILNRSAAVVPNTYLGLYPRTSLKETLGENPELLDKICAALSKVSTERLLAAGRTYGGQLHKLEPRDLAEVRVSIPEIAHLVAD